MRGVDTDHRDLPDRLVEGYVRVISLLVESGIPPAIASRRQSVARRRPAGTDRRGSHALDALVERLVSSRLDARRVTQTLCSGSSFQTGAAAGKGSRSRRAGTRAPRVAGLTRLRAELLLEGRPQQRLRAGPRADEAGCDECLRRCDGGRNGLRRARLASDGEP